jgi:uncharacterized delta-60 repeat protein
MHCKHSSIRTLLGALFGIGALFIAAPAIADGIELDPAFGNNGRANYTFGDYFRTLAHLPRPGGGSVAVIHYRSTGNPLCVDDRDCIALYPFNDAGAAQGTLTVSSALHFSNVRGAAIDSQGRVVVVGSILVSGGNHDMRVVRLLPGGSPDTGFSGDGIADIAFDLGGSNYDVANAVAIDAQDRVVVAGQVQRAASDDTDFGVARLRADGVLDAAFNGSGRRAIVFDLATTTRIDSASAIAVQGGRISVGGLAIDGGLGVSRIALARLTDGGAFDTTFCAGSCNFMSTYTGIHSGRRIIYYGLDVPAQADSLEALAVNAAGEMVIAGTTPGSGETFGYVQKFSAAGDWQAERSTDGGVAGSRVRPRSVLWAPGGNVILTGASGTDQQFFFAQRFAAALVPSANWGFIGDGNSVYLWTAGNGFGDVGGNRGASSSIDGAGRVLTGGSFKVTARNDPDSATIARLRVTGAPPAGDAIFKQGFEN